MRHWQASEIRTFLKYFLGILLIFLAAGSIQLGIILDEFDPKLVIMPIVLGVLMGVLLGLNAVLRMRLKHANQVKSEFISRISHELRTPMTSIIGFSQYLRHQADLDEKHRDYTARIYNAAEHLMALIDDLLDLNRIESGKITINWERVSLSDITSECVNMIIPLAEKFHVQVHNEIDDRDRFEIWTDRVRIRQVFMNILTNAVKFNKSDGKVFIRAEKHGHYVRVTIEDTGMGIPEDFIGQIFDYFTRHPEHADRINGVGIGMAISHTLVELMDAYLSIESQVGVGTRMWIDIPLARGQA